MASLALGFVILGTGALTGHLYLSVAGAVLAGLILVATRRSGDQRAG